ncbi:extracellular calcium-sensing receptor-like [Latimeria chalumnae]|uniref:extracellular calcium-sensing receptor-like n=1 Tax=Latimeria chalumnae TaxID=7897 RepID=UPI00313B1750
MWMITGQKNPIPNYRCKPHAPLAAIIGDAPSSQSISIARHLRVYSYPQVSYLSSAPQLNDKHQFPSFFRTIPPNNFLYQGLAQLMKHFGWTWVGILQVETDDGNIASEVLREELRKTNICIAFSEMIPVVYSVTKTYRAVEAIKGSSANAIVAITYDFFLIQLIEEVARQNITGKIWIANDAWSTSTSLFKKELAKTLTGTIGIAVRSGDIIGFKKFLLSLHPFTPKSNIYMEPFWEHVFNCKWANSDNSQKATNNELDNGVKFCTGSENLSGLNTSFLDVSNLRITYNVYTAVYAIAHALHDLNSCKPGEGPFPNGSCADIHDFEPWQLLYYLKKIHFQTKNGDEIYFDKDGNPPAQYDILNWHLTPDGSLTYVKVGSVYFSATQGQGFIINESTIVWNGGQTPQSVCSESCPPGYRKAIQKGQTKCCFDCLQCSEGEITNETDSSDCLKCPDDQWSNDRRDTCIPKPTEFLSYKEPLGATLGAITIFSALIPSTILCVFIRYRNTPIVKANNRELSYLLLLALVFCFLCSLIFIGYPTGVTCMLRHVAFGIIFALCVSCMLAKTIMVVIAFNATKPNSKLRNWVGPKLPNGLVFVCTLIQVIICIAWLISSPPFSEQNMKSQPGKIIFECNEGSPVAFWCLLVYMGLLALVCLIVAFFARNLPNSFNEAKFISFSMLVFVSVWLAFIPAYLSTRGKYMVAVEIFAILTSSTGLLACIFFPKCYIILLRPDMNTREYLMGKVPKG